MSAQDLFAGLSDSARADSIHLKPMSGFFNSLKEILDYRLMKLGDSY